MSPGVRGALGRIKDRRFVDPIAHLCRDSIGIFACVIIEPALLPLVGLLFAVEGKGFPELNHAGPRRMMRFVREGHVRQAHLAESHIVDDRIDDIEHRLRGPVARVDRKIPEFERAVLLRSAVLPSVRGPRPRIFSNSRGSVPWNP